MTPSTIDIATDREDHRIARLAALAIALSLMEADGFQQMRFCFEEKELDGLKQKLLATF